MNSNAEKIFRKFNSISDEQWKEIIRRSAVNPMIDGIAFPLVPDDATQCDFVGSTLAYNVNEPYQYYKAIKDIYESKIEKMGEETKLLDVGSGWGRIIRFFMKDIAPSNLMGCDVASKSVEICNSCFRGELDFQLINALPPTPYEENYYDIVEGYSVFTHLSFYAVILWIHEYFRILKPGGLLAMTVWKQGYFDIIRRLQNEPPSSRESERHFSNLKSSFSPGCELEEELYRKTGIVYIPYSSDPAVTYGEAFLAPAMLANHWISLFEHVTTLELDGQQIVLLRKRPDARRIDDELLLETASIARMFDIQSICVNAYVKKLSAELKPNYADEHSREETLLRTAEEQLADKTMRIEALFNSASWRVTRPLRWVYEILLTLSRKRR